MACDITNVFTTGTLAYNFPSAEEIGITGQNSGGLPLFYSNKPEPLTMGVPQGVLWHTEYRATAQTRVRLRLYLWHLNESAANPALIGVTLRNLSTGANDGGPSHHGCQG